MRLIAMVIRYHTLNSLQQTYNCTRYSRLRESHFLVTHCTSNSTYCCGGGNSSSLETETLKVFIL